MTRSIFVLGAGIIYYQFSLKIRQLSGRGHNARSYEAAPPSKN